MEIMNSVETSLLYANGEAGGPLLHRGEEWCAVFGGQDDPWIRLAEPDREAVTRAVEEVGRGRLVTNQVVQVKLEDRDDPLPVLLHFVPVRGDAAQPERTTHYTVTGEVLAEPETWTQSQTQRARFETLGRMTMGIAHDFNNLLSGILGYTELLRSGGYAHADEYVLSPESPVYEHLGTIEKAALDGAALIEKIQQYIRREKKTRFEPLDLRDLIGDCASLTRPYWYNEPRRKGIEIDLQTDLQEVPSVLGCGSELREVFINLILNAVQAMPKGGEIRITLDLTSSGNVRLRFSDTGIGMSESVQQHVFEPLFTTKGERGTGMGMAVSQGIIQEHDGTITFSSALGEGTTFTMTFPPAEDVAFSSAPEEQTALAGARLLIVDDEEMVRSILEKLLTLKGHEVTLAASGEEALGQLDDGATFDAVITDHGMPEMSGRVLAQTIRRRQPQLPLILLTGDTEVEEAVESVDAVLSKPFKVEEIQRTLLRLLPPS